MTSSQGNSGEERGRTRLSKLAQVGMSSDQTLGQQRQIAITNLFSLAAAAITLPWALVFAGTGANLLAAGTVLVSMLCAATLIGNARGYYVTSRLWLLAWSNLAIFAFSVALGPESGIPLLLTVTTCAPLVLFDPRDDRMPFVVGVLTPVGLGAAAQRFTHTHEPYLPLSDTTLGYLFPALLITTLLVLLFIVSYYYYTYERSRAGRERQHRAEQERLDHALRESEELSRQLVAQAADAVYFFDFDGRILEANQRAALELGYDRRDLLAMSMFDIDRDLSVEELRSLTRDLPEGSSLTLERVHRRKDGRAVAVELRLGLFQYRTSQHLLASARDISVRKQVEAQLMLADRMVSVGTLAAGVAHEVNNPLTSLLLNLELIERQLIELDPDALEAFRTRVMRAVLRAREGAERVGVIVRDLKTFSRGEAEVRDAVDLRRVIESTLNLAHPELKRRATVRTVLPSDLAAVRANEARLGQVFLNLLLNAAQAFETADPNQNLIVVRVTSEGETVTAEVIDNGSGIDEELVARIFDPFFTTKPVGVGTGLGLYICRNIVEACGGTLTCESQVGHGSTFRIRIPSVRSLVDGTAFTPVGAGDAAQARRRSLPPPGLRRSRVLVIDDDPDVLQTLREVLTGHEVELAVDIEGAMSLLRGERFDLILCQLDSYQRAEGALAAEIRGAPGRWAFMVSGSPAQGLSSQTLALGVRMVEMPIRSEVLWELLGGATTSTEQQLGP